MTKQTLADGLTEVYRILSGHGVTDPFRNQAPQLSRSAQSKDLFCGRSIGRSPRPASTKQDRNRKVGDAKRHRGNRERHTNDRLNASPEMLAEQVA